MMSQIVTSYDTRKCCRPPIVYTEHGAVMAANILRSERATAMSVEVVRAFVRLRGIASSHGKIARILAELEDAVIRRLDRHDKDIEALFGMMAALIDEAPEQNTRTRRIGSA